MLRGVWDCRFRFLRLWLHSVTTTSVALALVIFPATQPAFAQNESGKQIAPGKGAEYERAIKRAAETVQRMKSTLSEISKLAERVCRGNASGKDYADLDKNLRLLNLQKSDLWAHAGEAAVTTTQAVEAWGAYKKAEREEKDAKEKYEGLKADKNADASAAFKAKTDWDNASETKKEASKASREVYEREATSILQSMLQKANLSTVEAPTTDQCPSEHLQQPEIPWVQPPPGSTPIGQRPLAPSATGVVLSFDPVEYASGTTTFRTAFDKMTVKYHTEQAEFGGLAYAGPAFAYLKATVGFDPNGNSTDVFAGGGAFTSNVNTGLTGSLNAVVGFDFLHAPTTSFGVIGGYYGSTESLYGNVPGGTTQFSIMTDTWNAGQAGVFFKQSFTAGNVPFQFWSSVTGLWDRLRSGAFTGDGGGVKVNATLSFPLGPVRGRITGQYVDLNASGSVLGVPMTVNTQNWYVGAGISVPFGATPAPATSTFPVKALPTK